MSSHNSGDEQGHSYNDYELDNGKDLESKSEMPPVSAGTRSRSEQSKESKAPPGPACSKARHGERADSRTLSTPRMSEAKVALQERRRSERQAALEGNRFAAIAPSDDDGDQTIVCVNSDESEEEPQHPEKGKPSRKRRKVKAVKQEEPSSSSEEIVNKRGRPPQTTAYYVKRGDAVERWNQQKQKALELDTEKRVAKFTTSELRKTHGSSVVDKLEELENAPTEDIAQRTMEGMAEVWRVATVSKNIKGNLVKALKQAAAIGTASAEVLSQRAGNKEPEENESRKQIRTLRRELELIKREAQAAKEEADRTKREMAELRKELEEARRRGENKGRVRAVIEDSPPPSPLAPPTNNVEENDAAEEMEVDDPAPSTEVMAPAREEAGSDPPVYDDARRKAEILPPRETWPATYRPPIRGKVKILEDGILKGTRVKLVRDTRKPPPAPARKQKEEEPRRLDARSIMDSLAPKLMEWLKSSLSALGISESATSVKPDARPDWKGKKKGAKETNKAPKPVPAASSMRRGGLTPTTVPNKKLFSAVVSGGTSGEAPTRPTARTTAVKEPAAIPGTEAWVVVQSKKEKKASAAKAKTPTAKGRPKERNNAGGESKRGSSGKTAPPPKKGGNNKSQAEPANKPVKRKPPRTAAVTLTCPPGEYAQAMRVAREKINLRDIGIEALKPRRAATGAIILEVAGPGGAAKAEALKAKMEEALRDLEGVKVARPIKLAELRISRILDATTVVEIKEAISRLGECDVDEVRAGDIRPAPNGLGTLWVQCPIGAANKLAAAGRIGIGNGWSSPIVQALEPRKTRCYKCLEPGHVQASCPSTASRRSLCYRCSREGHVARDCELAPRCVICEEAGRPSAHKMGGKACKAPGKKAGLPRRANPHNPDRMEIDEEESPPAMQDGHPPRKETPAAKKQRRRKEGKEHRPAVRGEPAQNNNERTPVPVRSVQEVQMMEVEVEPHPAMAQPTPQGTEVPAGEMDGEASGQPGPSLP